MDRALLEADRDRYSFEAQEKRDQADQLVSDSYLDMENSYGAYAHLHAQNADNIYELEAGATQFQKEIEKAFESAEEDAQQAIVVWVRRL